MELRPSARALVRLAIVLLVIGAGAGVWELFAAQPPHSPFQAGVLEGPVAQLRRTAITYGLVLVAGAWLLPWAWPDREPTKLVWTVHGGVVLTMGAMLYGASQSLMGLQIMDLRTDARIVFGVRALGQALSMACLLALAHRVLLRRSRPRRGGSAEADRSE